MAMKSGMKSDVNTKPSEITLIPSPFAAICLSFVHTFIWTLVRFDCDIINMLVEIINCV